MKTLCLIRHAKSSWENPALDDFNRPLNERGLRDAPYMANLLRDTGMQPDLFVSSPANRALTTATIFAQAFDVPPSAILQNNRIYEASSEEIFQIIKTLPNEATTVLLFGHNPTFTLVANYFTAKATYISNVPTCGIVKIESTEPQWNMFIDGNTQVTSLYFPKQFFK